MTPDPALWNCRSRGFASGGTSKKRRKKGSSIKGLRCPGFSLMVPRVATLTTAGETRLIIGASDGIGAASTVGGAGGAANAAGTLIMAAASAAAANVRRRFMRSPYVGGYAGDVTANDGVGRDRPTTSLPFDLRSYT